MSAPTRYAGRMKLNLVMPRLFSEANLIATFGTARLMRKFNGDYYILGGSSADHAAAKEWVSMFCHEASISFPPTLTNRAPAATACAQTVSHA